MMDIGIRRFETAETDIHKVEKGFRSIRPEGNMSLKECDDFWDKLYDAGISELSEKKGESSEEIVRLDAGSLYDENLEQSSAQEKIEKQEREISSVENGKKNLDSTLEKGNYGEMKVDQDLRRKGYERISKDMVTDVKAIGHQGIDGVYCNQNGTPKYLIVDAKYGTAQLADTLDGKQMSENWQDKRLDESVGKEKADEIRMEKLFDPDNVGSYVAHIDENGDITYDRLDEDANIIGKDIKINE